MEGKIHIGTSGWHYKHWVGTFYPENTKDAEQLAYYLNFFKTVELNNSFYHLPPPQTFTKWKRSVPEDFVFAVKASRYITHVKKLKVEKENVKLFFNSANKLQKKLGPVLFQLHPKWKINTERLASFLKLLPKRHQYSFEFRDRSWYHEDVYELLRKHNCAFCIYELAGHLSPLITTADFIYIRLHGPDGKYAGSYSTAQLKNWATRCRQWQQQGKNIYVYFDNDQSGYAAFNAQTLEKLTK